jgi:hypothetical protein
MYLTVTKLPMAALPAMRCYKWTYFLELVLLSADMALLHRDLV